MISKELMSMLELKRKSWLRGHYLIHLWFYYMEISMGIRTTPELESAIFDKGQELHDTERRITNLKDNPLHRKNCQIPGELGQIPYEEIAALPLPIKSPVLTPPPFYPEFSGDSYIPNFVSEFVNRLVEILTLLALRQRKLSQDIVLLCMVSVLPCTNQTLCLTMPWNISIALAVLWGVCWMFYPGPGDGEKERVSTQFRGRSSRAR